MKKNKKIFLFGGWSGGAAPFFLLLTCFLPLFAGEREQRIVDSFMTTPGLPPDMAVMVTDLSTGEKVASSRETVPLVPASILKTVSIASLIGEIDPEDRIYTEVMIDGGIHSGVLEGNLIVVGGGDPSLNSIYGPESNDIIEEITSALKDKGVREIKGRIITDGSIFTGPAVPPSWAKGDLMHAYGTGAHGLNFRNNANGKTAVNNPAVQFENMLKKSLAQSGISIKSVDVKQGNRRRLIRHESAEWGEIMRSCMMRSDNLYAESILRHFAIQKGEEGSTVAGAVAEMKYWKQKGVDMKGVDIIDGSGLSRSNRVTAGMIDGVLGRMADDVEYVSFFPLAGQEGTLRRFLAETPLDSYIALKTGSMSGIQCYAGYKLDEDFAPTHTVVVIVNDFHCDRSKVRTAVGNMLLEIFDESPE